MVRVHGGHSIMIGHFCGLLHLSDQTKRRVGVGALKFARKLMQVSQEQVLMI